MTVPVQWWEQLALLVPTHPHQRRETQGAGHGGPGSVPAGPLGRVSDFSAKRRRVLLLKHLPGPLRAGRSLWPQPYPRAPARTWASGQWPQDGGREGHPAGTARRYTLGPTAPAALHLGVGEGAGSATSASRRPGGWPQPEPNPNLSPAHRSPRTHWAPRSVRCTLGWSLRCPGWPPWAGAPGGTPGQGACRSRWGCLLPPRSQGRRQAAPGRSPCSGDWRRPPAPRPRRPPRPTSWLRSPRRSLGAQRHTTCQLRGPGESLLRRDTPTSYKVCSRH